MGGACGEGKVPNISVLLTVPTVAKSGDNINKGGWGRGAEGEWRG